MIEIAWMIAIAGIAIPLNAMNLSTKWTTMNPEDREVATLGVGVPPSVETLALYTIPSMKGANQALVAVVLAAVVLVVANTLREVDRFIQAKMTKDRETVDREIVDPETVDHETVDQETVDHETVDHEIVDQEIVDQEDQDRFTRMRIDHILAMIALCIREVNTTTNVAEKIDHRAVGHTTHAAVTAKMKTMIIDQKGRGPN